MDWLIFTALLCVFVAQAVVYVTLQRQQRAMARLIAVLSGAARTEVFQLAADRVVGSGRAAAQAALRKHALRQAEAKEDTV